MTTNYPTAFDDVDLLLNELTDPSSTAAEGPLNTSHAELHNHISDAIIAIETELGTVPKGSYSTLVARLVDLIVLQPTANQTIQPTGDFSPIIVRAYLDSQTSKLFEVRDVDNNLIGSWDKTGIVDSVSYRRSGNTIDSAYLTDGSSILKLASPSITTPTLASPTFTDSPVAPTPSTADDSTTVATTAFVIAQAYAKAASGALTGNPTVPTPTLGDNTTKIATTAYVIDAIEDSTPEDLPTGTVFAYGGAAAPTGWLLCDGSVVLQATYNDLYTLIGATYGSDAGGNFTLPDLRGRIPVGKGTHVDVDTLNDGDGVGTVATRRPSHSHGQSLGISSGSSEHGSPSNGSAGSHSHSFTGGSGTTGASMPGTQTRATQSGQSTSSNGSHSHSYSSSSNDHNHTASGTIGLSGMTDKPAYAVVNYIIKT